MRASGLLLGIAGLPGNYGIGKLGKEAKNFVDFLKKSGQRYWQILPLSPTGYGDSPYQSCSVRAGNPYFIDFETLEQEGLLKPADYQNTQFGDNLRYIHYGMLYQTVAPTLKKAYERFKPDAGYEEFLRKNADWVQDYALYTAVKEENSGKPWYEWENSLKMARPEALAAAKERLADKIGYQLFVQYEFFKQWHELKLYANRNGVEIIGDMPIYCAYDSVEAWLNPELFEFDQNKRPLSVAGCPPDDYAKDGQLWGNPIYNWNAMRDNGYNWWINRIAFETDIYDVLRIDHFRGFAGYFSIPYGSQTAAAGKWRKGPGMSLFNSTNYWLGPKRIIAEDLGFVTDDVRTLLKEAGYPGMKVLQFAFDPNAKNAYLPCNFESKDCAVYTSTHDSSTASGWAEKLGGDTLKFCMSYMNITDKKDIPDGLLRAAWSSIADTAIAQPQDFLGLGDETRINVPGTLGLNWRWRLSREDLSFAFSDKLLSLTKTYNRIVTGPVPALQKAQGR